MQAQEVAHFCLTSGVNYGSQFQHSPGQLVNLLRVAVADEVDMGTRRKYTPKP